MSTNAKDSIWMMERRRGITLKISDSNEFGIAGCKAGWKEGHRMAHHL
jgi:hypothetical protein